MTLDQWGNLFVYAAMGVFALAFFAFAASFAGSRSTAVAAPAREPVLAGVGPAGGLPDPEPVEAAGDAALTAADRAAQARQAARVRSAEIEAELAREAGAGRRFGRSRDDAAVEPLPPGRRAGNIGMALTWLGFALLLIAVVLRGAWADRAPWGNMYEFSLASALAVVGVFLVVSLRRDVRWLGVLVTLAVLLTLGVAVLVLYTDSPQLVPALRSYWLIIHVAAAIMAGGAFAVGAAASTLYLMVDRAERDAAGTGPGPASGWAAGPRTSLRRTYGRVCAWIAQRTPDAESLDSLAYKVNAFLFPLWTFAVVAGAIWAEDAWGRYWNWDPKETWAFITWVVYAAYLHARATAGWKGRKAAVVGLIGFACFLINYYGVNLFADGLHSYSGL